MDAPPTRYRVVEKGRRLVVIDTKTGAPVRQNTESNTRARLPVQRSPAGVDDGSVFTTRRWYDDKAPRTVRMNYTTRQRLANLRIALAAVAASCLVLTYLFWPFFPIAVAVAAATPDLRKPVRAAATRWIDGLDQAA